MHSHHSHSGQFCQHAKNNLEQVVERAIELQFKLFCLTEHVPRLDRLHLYPEEIESNTTPEGLQKTFKEYYEYAYQLQRKYADKIKLLVGFEAEGIDEAMIAYIKEIQSTHKFNLFVGSLHHVRGIPIDFDQQQWQIACDAAGGTVNKMFGAYFDEQYEMIKQLKPPVIGHFDLIRLFAPTHEIDSEVWLKVVRNIELAVSLGCLFEINTSAIRKGWDTPYPQRDIADLIKQKGGKFCLSDDSHGISQVGLNYGLAVDYVGEYGPLYGIDGSVVDVDEFKKWLKSQ